MHEVKRLLISFYMALCVPIHLRQRTSHVYQDHQSMPSPNFPPVHNQGVSSAPLQGLALWNIFLPTTGSFFVCCITDFFPVTAPSGGRFPVTFHLLLNSSYHGWSQPSSSLSEGLRPAMIHCFFLFMLLAVFLVLRCHSASSDHHNPHLWLVSYKISGSAYMPPLSLTASFSVDFSPLSGNNYESL